MLYTYSQSGRQTCIRSYVHGEPSLYLYPQRQTPPSPHLSHSSLHFHSVFQEPSCFKSALESFTTTAREQKLVYRRYESALKLEQLTQEWKSSLNKERHYICMHWNSMNRLWNISAVQHFAIIQHRKQNKQFRNQYSWLYLVFQLPENNR